MVFGVLGVQALTSGTNLGQGIRNLIYRRADRRTANADLTALPDDAAADAAAITTTTTATVDEAALDGAPVLTVDGLTVQFGALKALDDVSFTVPAASIMGLIGPNGAGKSTFVDAISGFLPQHDGRVLLGDRDLAGLSPRDAPGSDCAARSSRTACRPRSRWARTCASSRDAGWPRPTSTSAGVLRLPARALPPVERGRGDAAAGGGRGERGRRPRLLILDEPAAGLSHEEHLALAARLRELPARYGVALIIIEHDLDLVRSVCPTLTVLDFGRVLASGPQAEVLANPTS